MNIGLSSNPDSYADKLLSYCPFLFTIFGLSLVVWGWAKRRAFYKGAVSRFSCVIVGKYQNEKALIPYAVNVECEDQNRLRIETTLLQFQEIEVGDFGHAETNSGHLLSFFRYDI
jgi:hypothetical protein